MLTQNQHNYKQYIHIFIELLLVLTIVMVIVYQRYVHKSESNDHDLSRNVHNENIHGHSESKDVHNLKNRGQSDNNYGHLVDKIAPKYDIDPKIMTTVMYMESRGERQPMKTVTFEGNRVYIKALKILRGSKNSLTKSEDVGKYEAIKREARSLASSHCATQILGLTARDFGVNYKELHDPTTCIETATFLMARHKENCLKYNQDELLIKCMARRYNGSRTYANKFYKIYRNM